MTIYELRTYTLEVGRLADAFRIYRELGWPAIEKYQDKLIGYFTSDTGALNQLVHLWRFDDDADRRRHWKTMFADPDFITFGSELAPLILRQESNLMRSAPWGPRP